MLRLCQLLLTLALGAGLVVQSATTVAAKHMDLEDQVGAIRVGLLADVVGVQGDPLQDLKRLRAVSVVIKEGRLIKSASL